MRPARGDSLRAGESSAVPRMPRPRLRKPAPRSAPLTVPGAILQGVISEKGPPRRVSRLPEASPGEQTGVSIGLPFALGASRPCLSREIIKGGLPTLVSVRGHSIKTRWISEIFLTRRLECGRLQAVEASGSRLARLDQWRAIKRCSERVARDRLYHRPIAPSLRVGRGLEHASRYLLVSVLPGLRPAFGLGEDWNSFGAGFNYRPTADCNLRGPRERTVSGSRIA